MDRFVNTVNARGYEGTSVSTDTALSYRFYEAYGFKLEKSFAQRAYKYSIPDKSFTALIYYLKISQ
jgi:predicted lactoylglutathione lyase